MFGVPEITWIAGILFCSLLIPCVSAYLTVSPSNTVATVGQAVTVLKCSVSNFEDSVDWWWIPSGQTEQKPIFQSRTLAHLYDNQMEVIEGSNGQYDLLIYNITYSDAGKYTCYDDSRRQSAVDKGYFASVELVVTGATTSANTSEVTKTAVSLAERTYVFLVTSAGLFSFVSLVIIIAILYRWKCYNRHLKIRNHNYQMLTLPDTYVLYRINHIEEKTEQRNLPPKTTENVPSPKSTALKN